MIIEVTKDTPSTITPMGISRGYSGPVEVHIKDSGSYLSTDFTGRCYIKFYAQPGEVDLLHTVEGLQQIQQGRFRANVDFTHPDFTTAGPALYLQIGWVEDIGGLNDAYTTEIEAMPFSTAFAPDSSRSESMLKFSQDQTYGNTLALPSQNLSYVEFGDVSHITSLNLASNKLSRIDSLGAFTDNLITLDLSNNVLEYVPSLLGLPALFTIDLSGNRLPITVVQKVLDEVESMVVATGLTGGTLDLSGGTNGVPSDLTPKTTLEGYSWTVTVNV